MSTLWKVGGGGRGKSAFFSHSIVERRRSRVVRAARYGTESRSKAHVRDWASPCDDWKTLSTQQ